MVLRATDPESGETVTTSTMSHYAPSGSVTRELKEISVIFPKTQVTDLLGALIE